MSSFIAQIFQEEIYKLIKRIGFIFLLINIFLFPTFSYLTNTICLLICNFFEYSILFFVAYSVIYHLYKKDFLQSFARPFVLFLTFIGYSIISTLITAGFSFIVFKELLKMIVCGCFLYLTLDVVDSEKRVKYLLFVFIISVIIMFATTFIYNIHSLGNIIEAFTGGKYRFGTKENQSNGYAVYCILAIFAIILFFIKTRKWWIAPFTIIPVIFCFGTQSKKGIMLCFLLIIFLLYKFLEFYLKSKAIRLLTFFTIIIAIIIGTVVLSLKLDIFKRFLNLLYGNDASTSGRAEMFEFALIDSAKCLFLGHGLGTFSHDFYRFSGTTLTFHSSLGYTFYSSGLFGLLIWMIFILQLFKKNNRMSKYFGIVLLFEIFLPFNDLTMQIWSQQILFIFSGLFSYLSEKYSKEKSEFYLKNIEINI